MAAAVPDIDGLARMARAFTPLLAADLETARDQLDAAVTILAANRAGAPVAGWGLGVVLRAVLDDRPAEARALLAGSYASLAGTNRAGLCYAEAVAAGRAGDAPTALALVAAGDQLLAAQPWWRRLLRLLVWRPTARSWPPTPLPDRPLARCGWPQSFAGRRNAPVDGGSAARGDGQVASVRWLRVRWRAPSRAAGSAGRAGAPPGGPRHAAVGAGGPATRVPTSWPGRAGA